MKNNISDGIIRQIAALSQLSLEKEELAQAKKDLSEVRSFFDSLQSVDTEGIEGEALYGETSRRLREDRVTNGDGQAETLCNAPETTGNMFSVPRTIG